MTKRRFCFTFFLLICFSFPLTATAQTVNIPDSNLRAIIAGALGKTSGEAITRVDMARFLELPIPNSNIHNLTGLEYATNLKVLNLGGVRTASGFRVNNNFITNISPLAGLTGLEVLNLELSAISDISPLKGLNNLTKLWLGDNAISNISPIEGLSNLTQLGLERNLISDISALEGLNNLRFLTLHGNAISDISALEGLNNLGWLFLDDNSISDVSPLVENTGLGSGDRVFLEGNPLNAASINTHIPTLQRRGVTVEFDNVIAEPVVILDTNLHAAIMTTLGKAPGTVITTADMAKLNRLVAPNANISNLAGLEHATNLTYLRLGPERPGEPNSNAITGISAVEQLTDLTFLDLDGNAVTDISTVSGLTNLTVLGLRDNSISDISAVSELTNLTTLGLSGNSISDIPALSGLTNLTRLWLDSNSISDISPLEGLTNLTQLQLQFNNISDISLLEGLDNIEVLGLKDNSISDISPVAELNNLTNLGLQNNSISDISPLRRLNNLEILGLNDNSISDLSALEGLNNLTFLTLDANSIADISPLVENTGLGSGDQVFLQGNPLNATAINTHIPALQSRGVTVEFDDVIAETVEIPDPNLRAKIEETLGKASGDTITTVDMAELTRLEAGNANINDVTGLEDATNLTDLYLRLNSISDISPLVELSNLTDLDLVGNSISDISPLANLANLTFLNLWDNSISDISPLANLTNLTFLNLADNSISDISPLKGLTDLIDLFLDNNSISDISPVARLNNLIQLSLYQNSISDISPLAGLNALTSLGLGNNSISDLSPLEGLNNIEALGLNDNSISDISPLERLTNLTFLRIENNSISDLSPLVANAGLGSGDTANVSENPLSPVSINTHIPALRSRGVEVRADNLKPTTSEYILTMPAGISLIHVPLKVTAVNRSPKTIESISELYDALGGASTVNFLITYDSAAQEWFSYWGASDTGTPADRNLTDDIGIAAGMKAPVSLHLSGNALGTNGNSTIVLNQGLNLVGLPLRDERINRVSDMLRIDGIRGNVPVITLSDGGEFKVVGRAGDPGDIEITGGQSFIMTVSQDTTVTISGDAWANDSGAAAAPSLSLKGIQANDTTPVLALKGAIVDEGTGLNNAGFRVTVKNLSTGRAVATVTTPDEAGYRSTVVDIETGRAATVGEVLEISARSPNPFIGVEPVRYTITAEDVKQSVIQLPELVAYEIPAETQLLCNYPNPFNPETWIPYQLAEDAFVTLIIYDPNGQVVRTLDVGHQTAAVYENRSKAIYWDGRNEIGEQVASGVYFYHLSAGDYSATRKMVILK